MGTYGKEELADLYRRRAGMVYQICLMLMKQAPDAEDAMQNVFRKVMERDGPFRDPEHEKAWLIVTARNECKDMLKHWWRTRREGEDALEPLTWEQEGDGELWRLILSLPEKERMVIYLHCYQGWSLEETARLMGGKPSTVRSWLFRGRKKLKIMLEASLSPLSVTVKGNGETLEAAVEAARASGVQGFFPVTICFRDGTSLTTSREAGDGFTALVQNGRDFYTNWTLHQIIDLDQVDYLIFGDTVIPVAQEEK